MVGKRGYFFVVDSIIAATILLFGLFYLFTTIASTPAQTQAFRTADDFAAILLYQQLWQSTNTYYTTTLMQQGLVPYPDNTAFEELGYLFYKPSSQCPTCLNHTYNFSQSLIDESLDTRFGAAIYINNTLIYSRDVAKTTVLFSRGVIIYTRMNSTTLIGPVIGEVQLWY